MGYVLLFCENEMSIKTFDFCNFLQLGLCSCLSPVHWCTNNQQLLDCANKDVHFDSFYGIFIILFEELVKHGSTLLQVLLSSLQFLLLSLHTQ